MKNIGEEHRDAFRGRIESLSIKLPPAFFHATRSPYRSGFPTQSGSSQLDDLDPGLSGQLGALSMQDEPALGLRERIGEDNNDAFPEEVKLNA